MTTDDLPRQIRAALNEADFPASKEELVGYAERGGADQAALKALRALPLGDYGNHDEVLRSVPLPPGVRAEDARNH